ncbi:hypothetical protein GAYE_SCF25G4448 [Galdieria yellowstonensis]|uniref:serine--tRNA ligase n=1 Tax=Galdieria yellowstonensis TaxID=3028027 RepID=A0AAV9IGP9_9RHOD|nr:hypothetical protein GAYE_SCF25G4448 [Galdieria yellowstonensis]
MLDINLFRVEKGGDPKIVLESQRKRFASEEVVQKVIDLDEQWRRFRYQGDQLRKQLNATSKEIGQKKRNNEEATDLMEKVAEIKNSISVTEKRIEELESERDNLLKSIGNIVHESVFVSNDESENPVVRRWGEISTERKTYNHVDLLHMVDGVEYERGVNVAGNRGYYLKGPVVALNLGLIHYGLQFLAKKGYLPLQTPYFMERDAMAKCAQLEDFDEQLYKVTGEGTQEKYLIATSEQPICCFHMNEWLDPKSLPLRYAGFSTCFRKETGSHGRDTLGIFRVHQFEKLEQFCITAPDPAVSYAMMEEMMHVAEEFYQSLNIPYRVVNIVSGALNNAAAKKYDLEGWFPASSAFRELVSCSNCTDYQARRLEIRYGLKKMGDREKKYVHMLNSTLCATTRVICCIMENFQTESGVKVPEVLQPFVGTSFLPFKREPLKITTADGSNKVDSEVLSTNMKNLKTS